MKTSAGPRLMPISRDSYNQARQRMGLTHREVAAKLHINEQTLYKWVRGQVSPNLEHLEALAQTLGVKIDDLLSK